MVAVTPTVSLVRRVLRDHERRWVRCHYWKSAIRRVQGNQEAVSSKRLLNRGVWKSLRLYMGTLCRVGRSVWSTRVDHPSLVGLHGRIRVVTKGLVVQRTPLY